MTSQAPRRRRRNHSPELKRDLVERSLAPGASVAAIALEAGINANLLFTWRRARLDAARATPPSGDAVLLPVQLQAPPPPPPPHAEASAATRPSAGLIEVEFHGARVRVRGVPDEAALRSVLLALRALA
ncbi:MAG: transposase [Paucibacter sp.]|nr:transposase [Roseateles sp.]